MRVVIGVAAVDVYGGQLLVGHVEGAHGLEAVALDGVVELHHGGERDGDGRHVVGVGVALSGWAVWLRVRVWWVDNLFGRRVLGVCEERGCAGAVSLIGWGEHQVVVAL